ncbi:MAG: hypothetical protein ACTJLN_04475 [Rickettsia amblyommatis]
MPKTIFSLGLLRPSRINIGVSPFFPSISALFVSKGTPKFFLYDLIKTPYRYQIVFLMMKAL